MQKTSFIKYFKDYIKDCVSDSKKDNDINWSKFLTENVNSQESYTNFCEIAHRITRQNDNIFYSYLPSAKILFDYYRTYDLFVLVILLQKLIKIILYDENESSSVDHEILQVIKLIEKYKIPSIIDILKRFNTLEIYDIEIIKFTISRKPCKFVLGTISKRFRIYVDNNVLFTYNDFPVVFVDRYENKQLFTPQIMHTLSISKYTPVVDIDHFKKCVEFCKKYGNPINSWITLQIVYIVKQYLEKPVLEIYNVINDIIVPQIYSYDESIMPLILLEENKKLLKEFRPSQKFDMDKIKFINLDFSRKKTIMDFIVYHNANSSNSFKTTTQLYNNVMNLDDLF